MFMMLNVLSDQGNMKRNKPGVRTIGGMKKIFQRNTLDANLFIHEADCQITPHRFGYWCFTTGMSRYSR